MELTAAEAWTQILQRAHELVPQQSFKTWLGQTEPLALTHDVLEVGTRNQFVAEWIQEKYGAILDDVARRLFGRPVRLEFLFQPGLAEPGGRADAAAAIVGQAPAPPGRSQAPVYGAAQGPPPAQAFGSPLNPRYTFDRFVSGLNNEFAIAASNRVAEAPARTYNPLFIYGGVGLGKTHLMHAIGHAILARFPGRRVAYVSSERFTNDLIVSIQEGRMPEFRRRYRGLDLLLIDDVHFLGEKERTQEEFFHTFNALYDAQGQIVLTSDRPPKEIPGLEQRLVSRFEWGLVTDIKPPDLETRVAILRKKADEDSLTLDDEILDFIARNCRSNVRELEGAVIKLLAYASLSRREVTIDLAREVLGGQLQETALQVTPELIRARVAEVWGVSVEALMSSKRTRELTVPRQVAMYLVRQVLDLALVEIGRFFGGRDHSTVIHSIQKVEQDTREDPALRQQVEALKTEFGA